MLFNRSIRYPQLSSRSLLGKHRFCPTASEAVLWSALKARQLGASFRRQVFRIVRVSAELVLSDLDAAIRARPRRALGEYSRRRACARDPARSDHLPGRAQPGGRARLWGRSAPRRRPTGGEERRVPTPRFVEQRGGNLAAEREGFEPLGRLLTYVRLASGYLRPLGHLSKRFSEAREGENVAAGGLGSSGIGVPRKLTELVAIFGGVRALGALLRRGSARLATCCSAVLMCRGRRLPLVTKRARCSSERSGRRRC